MMENNFFIVFNYILTYILMPHSKIILCFHLPDLHVSNRYKWARVSCSGAAAFHLVACFCTSGRAKELIGADKASMLTHASHYLFSHKVDTAS